ncbi:lytic transglycosylase, partial [Escherichia coli]
MFHKTLFIKKNQQKLVFAWGVVLLVVRTTNLLSLFV